MKNIYFFIFVMIFSVSFAQIEFEDGYFIQNDGNKIDCLIKNTDWKNNPTEFEYRLTEDGETLKRSISDTREFRIGNVLKFIRETVEMDRSSEIASRLSNDRSPLFEEETLFLKVLVEGENDLYSYTEGNLIRYFFKNAEGKVEQLVNKHYLTNNGKVGENQYFKNQLLSQLNCESISRTRIQRLNYSKNNLITLFEDYNKCDGGEVIVYKSDTKGILHLTIRPRLNFSSVRLLDLMNKPRRNVNFGRNAILGAGLEIEYILPINKNKWSILFEPTYHSFKDDGSVSDPNISGGIRKVHIEKTIFTIGVGARYYMYLNQDSKFFLSLVYLQGIGRDKNSFIKFSREDGSLLDRLSLTNSIKNNFGFGVGYKFKDKFSAEIRLETDRLLYDTRYWVVPYNNISLILGYSIF